MLRGLWRWFWAGGVGTAPVTPGGAICGTVSAAPRLTATVSATARVAGVASAAPAVTGTVSAGGCCDGC